MISPGDSPDAVRVILDEFIRIIQAGGLIVFPTETSYLLGADGHNAEAVGRLFRSKNRPRNMPLSMAFHNIESAKRWTLWDARAHRLADRFLPGPLTLILPLRAGTGRIHGIPDDNVGIRVPGYPLLLDLLSRLHVPLTATSANLHGAPEPYEVDQCVRDVDLILDAGCLPSTRTSTIVSLCKDPPVILREGAIPSMAIFKVLTDGAEA